MTRTLVVMLAIAALLVPARPTAAGDERPNVVVIMLDDLAADVADELFERQPVLSSFFLDRGIGFRNAFGNDPLCCPARATFLTGLYSHHHGVTANDGRLFDPSVTIATALQDVGYHTIASGKYLNDFVLVEDKTPPGWDHSVLAEGGYRDVPVWVDGVQKNAPYSTDYYRDRALGFLRKAPLDKPLFLYLSPFAPHGIDGPYGLPQPAVRHRGDARCKAIGTRLTPAWDAIDGDEPAFMQAQSAASDTFPKGWPLGKACRSLLAVDEMFRDVRLALREQGRLSNTLFILTVDNGMAWGDHRWPLKGVSSSTPLMLWMRWPARWGAEAREVREWVQNIDLAPTIAEAAGVTLGPFPTGQAAPDGRSLLPVVDGTGTLGRDALLEEHRSDNSGGLRTALWWGIRTTAADPSGLWHYIEYDTGERELFDLTADPWQLTNLAGEPAHADTEAALALRLEQLRAN